MNDDNFDYVVLGTNLSENILAAGLAIQGEKCLLLDKASRYGGHLSNFNLMHYFDYVDAKLSNTRSDQQNKDGYHSFSVLKQFDKSFGEDPESTHLSRKTLMDEFMRTSRACNIDLAPKILFS